MALFAPLLWSASGHLLIEFLMDLNPPFASWVCWVGMYLAGYILILAILRVLH